CSWARRAAASAAIWAAKGVDLREPLKPTWPEEAQLMTAPFGSVRVTIVLLNVLLMWACPCVTFLGWLGRGLRAAEVDWRDLGGMWCFSPGRRTGARGAGRRDVRPDYLAGLLLAGHRALGALAGAGVGLGALSADGQSAAVTQALVGADLDLAADVGLDLAAEVTLDLEVALDVVTKSDEVAVGHVLDAQVRAHARGLERLLRAGPP